MWTTIKVAQFWSTIVSNPAFETTTLLGFEVKNTVTWTIGKALTGLFIQDAAIQTFPAFFANTRSIHTKSVIWTSWIRAIDLIAKFSSKTFCTLALAFNTSTSSWNVEHFNEFLERILQIWSTVNLPEQSATSHSSCLKLHSLPFHPGWHSHSPFL